MTGHLSECRGQKVSRVRFQREPLLLATTASSYGAVERATPTQQVSGWLSRTASIDLMPSLRTLLKRSRSRTDMGNRGPSLSAMKRDASCTSLVPPDAASSKEPAVIRKCETVLALSSLAVIRSASSSSRLRAASSRNMLLGGDGSLEPMKPVNRLRVPAGASRMCSRCSSLLSMASSRYSLNVDPDGEASSAVLCKLCLADVPIRNTFEIEGCGCIYCKDCMKSYVEFEIQEGAYDMSCPDAQCERQGVISMSEIESLVTKDLVEKHNRFRLNKEIDLDLCRTWCPRAGCETVCDVCPTEKCLPQSVHCPTCTSDFCSNCKEQWHTGLTCEENTKKLTREGRIELEGIPFDSDLIKCCPMCNVPIEKDAGCAQMMCKRCKHVFCWYCLASLDDDFLLRHYDKGPCKNKLGHSRASVIWHRTQVIGIFAGFGILLLVASPLLLLAAPCIVCCKCRMCSNKFDEELEESVASNAAS